MILSVKSGETTAVSEREDVVAADDGAEGEIDVMLRKPFFGGGTEPGEGGAGSAPAIRWAMPSTLARRASLQ